MSMKSPREIYCENAEKVRQLARFREFYPFEKWENGIYKDIAFLKAICYVIETLADSYPPEWTDRIDEWVELYRTCQKKGDFYPALKRYHRFRIDHLKSLLANAELLATHAFYSKNSIDFLMTYEKNFMAGMRKEYDKGGVKYSIGALSHPPVEEQPLWCRTFIDSGHDFNEVLGWIEDEGTK